MADFHCAQRGQEVVSFGPGSPPSRCEDCTPETGPGSRIMEQFAINLRELRLAAGIRSSELARRAGPPEVHLPFSDRVHTSSTTAAPRPVPLSRGNRSRPEVVEGSQWRTDHWRTLNLSLAAKRGDSRAYEQIVKRHQTIAFRVAWTITGSAADAEKVAQDAFVKAHRALGRFRDGAPFRPWLLRIVANEAHNRRAASSRRRRLAKRLVEEHRQAGAVPSPEAALLDSVGRAELLAALGRLPEKDRVAVVCRYFLELSESEMAAALRCRPGTVKSRLSRALGRLRAEMEVGVDD